MVQEADMIPIIENHFQRLGYITFTEVSVGGAGHGIADVVAIKLNPDKVIQRIENKQYISIKNEVLVNLLRYITEDEKGTSINQIEKKLSFTRSHIKNNLINELVKGHYVIEVDKNRYKKINNIVPLASEVISIEAKKEAWIAATQQARRYQSYANRVYVALLDEFTHRVDKSRLQNHNIGLISIDVNKEKAKYIWKSRYRKPINQVSNFLAHESIWERIRVDLNSYLPGEEHKNEFTRV